MSCLIILSYLKDTEAPTGGGSSLHDGQTAVMTEAAPVPIAGLKQMGTHQSGTKD